MRICEVLWPGNKLKPKPIHIVSYLYGSLSWNPWFSKKKKPLLPLNIPVDSTEKITTHRLSRCLEKYRVRAWSFTESSGLRRKWSDVQGYDAHHSNKITSASGLHLQNTPRIPALLPPSSTLFLHSSCLSVSWHSWGIPALDTPKLWRRLHSRHGSLVPYILCFQPGPFSAYSSLWTSTCSLPPGLCICCNLLLLDLSRTIFLIHQASWEMVSPERCLPSKESILWECVFAFLSRLYHH